MKYVLMTLLLAGFLFSASAADLAKIDKLSDSGNYEKELLVLNKMVAANPGDVDLLWRQARAHFDIADQTEDKAVHKAHFYPGLEAAKAALAAEPNSAMANHWYAVLIGKIGMLEGTKQKIINSYDVQKYALKAIELDPTYDGTYHVMGRWNYELADLSWIERKVAGLVYSTPPDGSFEDAAKYFRKAIDAKPDEIRHYVWLAKSLMEMDQDSSAKLTLEDALAIEPKNDSDRLLLKEARQLLKKL